MVKVIAKSEMALRVTARLQNADNSELLTQSSKIDNAFASSVHFSSGARVRSVPCGMISWQNIRQTHARARINSLPAFFITLRNLTLYRGHLITKNDLSIS